MLSSSAVALLLEDAAGEVGVGRDRGEASATPSCAEARGGDDEEIIEDVFAVPFPTKEWRRELARTWSLVAQAASYVGQRRGGLTVTRFSDRRR